MAEQWSTETEELVQKAIFKHVHPRGEWAAWSSQPHLDYFGAEARAVLGALADAGLLVRPGPTVGICGDRLGDVAWALCDLPAGHEGWHGAPNPPDHGVTSRMSWTVRDETSVLTPLSRTGPAAFSVPLEPDAAGPRVWAMPQIPPDVVKVRAAFDGSIWVRHGKGWVDEEDDGEPNPEADLIADLGPLTEVLPNGD